MIGTQHLIDHRCEYPLAIATGSLPELEFFEARSGYGATGDVLEGIKALRPATVQEAMQPHSGLEGLVPLQEMLAVCGHTLVGQDLLLVEGDPVQELLPIRPLASNSRNSFSGKGMPEHLVMIRSGSQRLSRGCPGPQPNRRQRGNTS